MTADRSTDRLSSLLHRAASDGVRDGRIRQVESPDQALNFVLDHIRTTMLARDLSFALDGRAQMLCQAVGGRLAGFSTVTTVTSDGDLPDGARAATAENLAAIAQDMRTLCAGVREIAVTITAPATEPDATRPGLSTAKLAEALGLYTPPDDQRPRLRRFAEDGAPHLICIALLMDEFLEHLSGSDANFSSLMQRAQSLLPDIEDPETPLGAALAGGGLLFLGQNGVHQSATLVAVWGEDILFAQAAPGSEAALIKLWDRP